MTYKLARASLRGMLAAASGLNDEFKCAAIDAAKNGTRDVIAAVTGKQLWIYGLVVCGSAGDGTAKFQDSTPTALTGTMTFDITGNAWLVLPLSSNAMAPWFKTAAAKKLQVVLSADMDLDGFIVYQEKVAPV